MDPQINDIELLENLHGSRDRFLNEIGKTIIGQTDVLHHILIALFCKGHTLIVGVPGLAKTLMVYQTYIRGISSSLLSANTGLFVSGAYLGYIPPSLSIINMSFTCYN